MTKSQKYLVGAVLALLGVVIFVFRADLFFIPNRPGVTALLQNWIQPYGLGVFMLLLGYLLAKSFNLKWWVFILLFVAWELTYVVVLNFGAGFLPDKAKLTGWLGHFKRVALDNRSMVQFQEETAQYDKELFYTLRPGQSRFRSFEFNTLYNVNALGVRDDAASLEHPRVIFLGDSFTMGWGVEQDQCFPAVFEKKSGLKCLSTGVSSYGTAREMRMLARTQTDSLKAIIIQFHDTDLEENNFYIKNNRLGSRTQADFDAQVADNKKYASWFPFKYVKTALLNAVAGMKAPDATEAALKGNQEEYPAFLSEFYSILTEIREISDVPVILTYTGSFYTDPGMIQRFERFGRQLDVKDIYFVNLGRVLNYEDYFYFDDHMNAKGHEKAADALWAKYREVIK
ncbi:SGNH/GDSL hydrolase family protein [Leadbetterella sp. DM7]|uniref:SGNH/GDSL hydrolase family protein n=1 Tax=Leadbetterella sp. DM7 TaxID=3235085 RepID=UPI00349E62E9